MVFSKPEVIELVKQGFIPVALKAATVQNPPPGPESQIYHELRRTQPAPQGICVANSAGKTLAWSLGFDDGQQVAAFFRHAKDLYAANPDSATTAQRYRRSPTARMPDALDDGRTFDLPAAHADGDHCPGALRLAPGSIPGRIVGRAFNADGQPLSEIRSQDNYIEDILEISKPMQDQLLATATSATGKFRIPQDLAREFTENAYLGMLDVNPLGGDQVRARLIHESIEFYAEKQSDNRLTITGKTSVSAKNRDGDPRDRGRLWSHDVALEWHGFIDIDPAGITGVALLANGHEHLVWGGPGSHVPENAAENPAAHLLSGRPLNIATPVRYGLTARR